MPVVVALMELLATAGSVIAGILSVLAAIHGLLLLWANIKKAK